MKAKMSKVILLSAICLSGVAVAANAPLDMAGSSKQTLAVTKAKPEVSITLHANATTGYSWLLKNYNSNFLTPTGYHYEPPKSEIIGAPGVATFTFSVKPAAFTVPQVASVTFSYARPWDMASATTETFYIVSH